MTYWLYRALAALPLSALYALAGLAAWLLCHWLPYRKSVITRNLTAAFPESDEAEIDQLRTAFYHHFADTTMEIIASWGRPMGFFGERVEIENPELLEKLSLGWTQSVVVMTLHQGNWEWMLHKAIHDFPLQAAPVYKRLHNGGSNRFSLEARSQHGATPIEMRDVSRNVLRHRRTPRLIYVLGDQSPGARERVHWHRFLNQPTAFFGGAAALARVTGFPMAFASCTRIARGHYSIRLTTISDSPKDLEENQLVARYVNMAQAAILQEPASWLWSNRRWKLTPPVEADGLGQADAAAEGSDAMLFEPSASEIQSNPSD